MQARKALIPLGIIIATITVLSFLNSIVVVYVLYVVGGLVLMFAPFDRKRLRTRLERNLLAACGVLLLLGGVVKLLMHYGIWTPSLTVRRGLPHTLGLIDGLVLGLLLAFTFFRRTGGQKTMRDWPKRLPNR